MRQFARAGGRGQGRFNGRNHPYQSSAISGYRQDLGSRSRILNLRHGETASHITMVTWMRDVVRPTIGLKCPKNGIKNVVNDDGSIGDYLEIEEPEAVDEDATYAEKLIYKNRRTLFDKLVSEYDQDKLQAATEIWELIGPDSRVRLREFNMNPPFGWVQVDLDLPVELLRAVLKCHVTDRYQDIDLKVDARREVFANMKMLKEETLHRYYDRWKLNERAYRDVMIIEAHELAEHAEIAIGNQAILSKRFLTSLDQSRFGAQVIKYKNGDRDWPHQVFVAFQECEQFHDNNPKAQYIPPTNRRGAFAANVNGHHGEGSKCGRCGLTSHATSVCRNVLPGDQPGRGGGRSPGRSGGRGRGRGRTTNVRANTPGNYSDAASGNHLNG